eukprot:sb/3462946/
MHRLKQNIERVKQQKENANKFETLCNIKWSVLSLTCPRESSQNLLKNELLQHQIPPSVEYFERQHVSLNKARVRLLMAPVKELVRLVMVHKQSLEEKSIALKRIDEENQRRKSELDVAVRKLEQTYNYEKQWRRDHTLNNWERMFCKAALNRTHGRRWKFVISKVKQRAALGLSVFNPMLDTDSESDEHRISYVPRLTYGSTTASSANLTTRQSTSRYTTPASKLTSSAIQSSLLSSSLKMDTSGETDDEDTQDTEPLPNKIIKSPPPNRSVNRSSRSVQKNDVAVSTEDTEYDKALTILAYNLIGFKLDHTNISCKFSLLQKTAETAVLNSEDESAFEEVGFLFEGEEYKNLGYKRGTSIGDIMEEEVSEQLEITIHTEGRVFAISTVPVEDISDSQPEIMGQINVDDAVPKPFPIFSLEGDVTAPCGYLPIYCVWQLKAREKRREVGVMTDDHQQPRDGGIVLEDDEEDEEEIEVKTVVSEKVSSASPALSRKSVSVMIPTPKPPSEPTTPEPMDRTSDEIMESIVRSKTEEMAIAHAQEIERLQLEYEIRLEGMAKALEMLKMQDELGDRAMEFSKTPVSMVSCFTPATGSSSMENRGAVTVPSLGLPRSYPGDKKRPHVLDGLPKKLAYLVK